MTSEGQRPRVLPALLFALTVSAGLAPVEARAGDAERAASFFRLLDRADAFSYEGRHPRADELCELAGAMAKANGGAPWLIPMARFARARHALRAGDAARALDHLEAAVAAGFADDHALQEALPPKLRSNPRVQKIYASMRLSAGDLHELRWLIRERATLARELNQILAENIRRRDRAETRVPLSAIPTRPTASLTVLGAREALRFQQSVGLAVVRESDLRLRRFVAELDPGDRRLQRSREEARLRAFTRLAAVRERAFKPLSEGADAPAVLPPLGSIPREAEDDRGPPAVSAEERAADPNPMAGLRVGDRWVYDQVVTTAEGRFQAVYEETITAVTSRSFAAESITRVPSEAPATEHEAIRLEETLRRQLINELGEVDGVEVAEYSKAPARYQWRGQEREVTRVRLVGTWINEGVRQKGAITLLRNDQLPGLGAYRIELEQAGTHVVLDLRSYQRGPAPAAEDPNPMKAKARLGDWFRKRSRSYDAGGKLLEESEAIERVTALDGARYVTRSEEKLKDGSVRVRDFGSFLQGSLRGQLIYDLETLGELGLLAYASRRIEVQHRGQTWPCQEVSLRFDLDDGGGPARFSLTLVRSDKLPGLGVIRSTLSGEDFRVETELIESGRAKE